MQPAAIIYPLALNTFHHIIISCLRHPSKTGLRSWSGGVGGRRPETPRDVTFQVHDNSPVFELNG